MNIHRFNFNPISENTWLVWDDTLEAAVIDAGNSNSPEDRELDEFVADNGLRVVLAIQTHGHFDHAMGVAHVVERYGARTQWMKLWLYAWTCWHRRTRLQPCCRK